MFMVKSFRVNILGRDYHIKSEESDDDVRGVIQYLEKKAEDVAKRVGEKNAMVLVALNIADEYFRERKKNFEYKLRVKNKIEKIVSLIDSKLKLFI